MNPPALKDLLQDAGACGFGVCSFHPDLLINPNRQHSRLPPHPKSILLFLFPYRTHCPEPRNLALYAVIPDYHTIVGALLEQATQRLQQGYPKNRFASFVDASPIREVEAAARAGLGARGENGLLITPNYGATVFIGEIVTDLSLPETGRFSRCDGCGACIAACPTGALRKDGFDKTLCRSYISQKKGALTVEEQASLREGGLVWGCDCCSIACPHSQAAQYTTISAFTRAITPYLTPENLDTLLPSAAYGWRGRDVLLRNLKLRSD